LSGRFYEAAFAFVATLFPVSCPHVQTGKFKIAPGKIVAAGHPFAAG
jgi:hypothetical protein